MVKYTLLSSALNSGRRIDRAVSAMHSSTSLTDAQNFEDGAQSAINKIETELLVSIKTLCKHGVSEETICNSFSNIINPDTIKMYLHLA